MTRKRDSAVDPLLRRVAPPQPPAELRTRVLDAAREAAVRNVAPDLWSRLWCNRGLRAAWVLAVALLLAAHAVLSMGAVPSRRETRPGLQARHSSRAVVGEISSTVRISADARPIVGRAAPGRPPELVLKGDHS